MTELDAADRSPLEGAPQRARPGHTALALLALLALALAVRIPLLASAELEFNSDEAVNALVLRDLVAGDWTFYNWDATYYGIFESLLALPFVAVLGWTALAFKLGSLVGFAMLQLGAYLLARRLYGPRAGLVAAALLVAFSPEVVGWSARASGGYTLVVGWGTFLLLALARVAEKPTFRRVFLAGFLAGFGLYIYEIFLLFVALVPLSALGASSPWRLLVARDRADRRSAFLGARFDLAAAATFAFGLALGWAPKLWVLATGTVGSKKPLYGLVDSETALKNLDLWVGCVQALFGINPFGREDLSGWVGPTNGVTRALGLVVVALYAAAWAWAAWRVIHPSRGELRGLFRRVPKPVGLTTLLVVLPLLPVALFVLSPNPQDLGANRYLLSWLAVLPVVAAGLLTAISKRGRLGALVATTALAVLIGLPLVQIAERYRAQRLLDARYRVTPQAEPLRTVLRTVENAGARGGYAGYWEAYEINFLSLSDRSSGSRRSQGSGSRPVTFASRRIWDRHPQDLDVVAKLPREAYVFDASLASVQPQIVAFDRRLQSAQRIARIWRIGQYILYTSADGKRLLPPPLGDPPPRLERPLARLALTSPPPSRVAPGAPLALDLRATNESDGFWSAEGTPTGDRRTAAGTRWFEERNRVVVSDSGRSPLPWDLAPRATADLRVGTNAPTIPGRYILQITMIQENVAWFADVGGGEVRVEVEVGP